MVSAGAATDPISPSAVDPAAPCCGSLVGSPLAEDDADDLAGLLKALADPVRLRLVSLIAAAPTGEVCACDLAEPVGRSQPTVSHHLSVLTRAGVLLREQRGKWAWFSVEPDRLTAISDALRPGRSGSPRRTQPANEADRVSPVGTEAPERP